MRLTDWLIYAAIYVILGALAFLFTVVENMNTPPYFDRANPYMRALLWPVFLFAALVVVIVNAMCAWRPTR